MGRLAEHERATLMEQTRPFVLAVLAAGTLTACGQSAESGASADSSAARQAAAEKANALVHRMAGHAYVATAMTVHERGQNTDYLAQGSSMTLLFGGGGRMYGEAAFGGPHAYSLDGSWQVNGDAIDITFATLGFMPHLKVTPRADDHLSGDAGLSGGVTGNMHLELSAIPVPEKYLRAIAGVSDTADFPK
jgi:hypothetical protein